MKTGIAVLLTVAGLVAAPLRADDKPKDDKKGLEGAWVVATADVAGTTLDMFVNATFEFKGDKFTMKGGDETREGTYKIDMKKKPPTLDVTLSQGGDGGTFHTIYELDGDKLKIASGAEPGAAAPTEFKSKEGVILMTLKRKTL